MIEQYLTQTLLIVAILSGVPLVVSSLTGLFVAVIQAATQIQEQSVPYLAKLCAIGVVIAFMGNFAAAQLIQFMQQLLGSIASLGKM